jgi:DMSO/TMAO reductase YedYZ molybdopterin-dependent catalytic subunit
MSDRPVHGRRQILAGLCALPWLRISAAVAGAAPASDSGLIALPGKKPLIKRTFRPPNFETPLADLRAAFTPNEAFFVRYHLGFIPELDPPAWRLRIGGASARKRMELSLADLQRNYERVTIAAVNQCSGNRRGLFTPRAAGIQWTHGAIGNASWTGVRLRDLLDHAGVNADALEVIFDGADAGTLAATPDFSKSLPVDRARDEGTIVAFEMNGEPLPHWHGAPARLVVPGWTATYWVKHLTEVRIEPRAHDGFWMKSAYRIPANAFPAARFRSQENDATWPITDILVNSLITSHRDGDRLPRGGGAELSGWAWDGGAGIRGVEISVDEGRTWREAALGGDLGRYAWRQFRFPVDTKSAGRMTALVRATSRAGARQPDALVPNPSGYHHNAVQRVQLEIA